MSCGDVSGHTLDALDGESDRVRNAGGRNVDSRELQRCGRAIEAGAFRDGGIGKEERIRSAVDEARVVIHALVAGGEVALAVHGEDGGRTELVVGLRSDAED